MADMWTVTSQQLDTQLSDSGTGFQTVWKVNYQVTSGPASNTRGTVVIPTEQYNAETVKAAIDAAVYHLDKVAGL